MSVDRLDSRPFENTGNEMCQESNEGFKTYKPAQLTGLVPSQTFHNEPQPSSSRHGLAKTFAA